MIPKKLKTDNKFLIKRSEIDIIESIVYKSREKEQLITDEELSIISKIFQSVVLRGKVQPLNDKE